MGQSIKGVEIFGVGKWKDSEFTKEHLDEMVKAFDVFGFIPPLKLGHDENQKLLQRDGMPAAGWVERIYRVGTKLIADFKDIPDVIATAIKRGAYRQISSEIYFNFPAPTGKGTFSRVLRAVALLGADNPAVPTLRPIDPLALFNDGGREYFIFNYNVERKTHLVELFFFADDGIKFVIGRLKGKETTETQSVLFEKSKWDEMKARKWLEDHNMRSDKVDVTENTLRFRQRKPDDFERLRTITPGTQNATHQITDKSKKKLKDNKEEIKMADKIVDKKDEKTINVDALIKKMTEEFNAKLENQKKDFTTALASKDEQVKSLALKLTNSETERENEKVGMMVDGWVKDGKITPANKSTIYSLLTNLVNNKSTEIKFSDSNGKEVNTNVFDLAVKIFSGIKNTVDFSETAVNNEGIAQDENVDAEVNRKTLKYMADNKMKDTEFADALRKTLNSDADLKTRYKNR